MACRSGTIARLSVLLSLDRVSAWHRLLRIVTHAMANPLPTHLRAHRKRLGLTQGQLADLLGLSNHGSISRFESYLRRPDIETVLRLQLIYGLPAQALWPGVALEQRRALLRAARAEIARRADGDARRSNHPAEALKVIELRCLTSLSADL